jgi:cytochrome c-type biogenesis protein
MLFVYSLGLGIPFVASAVLIDRLKAAFDLIKRNYRVINLVSGLMLIAVGILMATGLMGRYLALLAV